jgi:signal transduction histidine kinase
MDFMEGRDKRFYVVTWEGVGINEWDRKTGKTAPPEWLSPFWYPTPDKDSSIFLSSRLGSRLIEDAQGNLVYGTTEAGLNIIDKDTRLVTKYLPNPQDSLSLPDNYVTDLCVAPDGILWVATQRGLWTPTGKSYLRGKLVQSVRADTQGRLWAGTEEGLYFVDTDGSLGVVKKGLGFPSDLYGEKTACVLSDGRLAFGGPEGMALFHPDSLLALKGSDNLLLAPLRKHRYRLNGGRWIESAFAGLPDNMRAGRYILEEQTSDLFGRWNRGETSVRKLRVPPPLWLRWPFLLLYLLLAVAVLWTFVRLRERRLLMAELDKRNRFFSIISHDLRNPVSGNRMLARELLLQADHLTPQQLKEGIRALSESADKASSLLENLLVWSLNQKGMLKPVKREEDLNSLVEDAISSIRGGELIQVDIPEGLSLQTDRNMLLTCLRNLLDNAVKVTPPGGKVTLKARGTRITIADEGPGLKEGTRAWGHGLGLVITRELLEKMGASLQMENRPEGGLEIRIDL